MPLFKLTGSESSVLTLHLEHPLHLDENADYQLALVGFFSDNYINNLRQEANVYFWHEKLPHTPLTFTKGYWTMETLQKRVRKFIASLKLNIVVNANAFKIEKNGDRVSIYSPLKFWLDATISSLLGFKEPTDDYKRETAYYEANESVTASSPPNLRAVDAIEIHCDIVHNSYVKHDEMEHKHVETAILYSFFPDAPHGYKISEVPLERHYIPLKRGVRKIQQIWISLMDTKNQPLQNPCANNIVYLDMIRVPRQSSV